MAAIGRNELITLIVFEVVFTGTLLKCVSVVDFVTYLIMWIG